jgi:hypothetical protein
MATLSGYGAETKDEKAERERREAVYGKTPVRETKPRKEER